MIKLNLEYGAIASKAAQPHSNSKAAAEKASAPSNVLALPGIALPVQFRTFLLGIAMVLVLNGLNEMQRTFTLSTSAIKIWQN